MVPLAVFGYRMVVSMVPFCPVLYMFSGFVVRFLPTDVRLAVFEMMYSVFDGMKTGNELLLLAVDPP